MNLYVELWRLLDRRRRVQLLALLATSAFMALATLAGVAAVLPFFGVLAGNLPAAGGMLAGAVLKLLPGAQPPSATATGVLLVAAIAVSNVANLAGSLAIARFAQATGADLATALLDSYLHRDYPFHLQQHGSALLARVTHECGRVAVGIVQGSLVGAASLMTSLLIVGGMLVTDPWASATVLGALGAVYALLYLASRDRLFRNGQAQTRLHERRTQTVSEALRAIREVLLLRQQATFTARFAALSQSMAALQVRSAAIAALPRPALETLGIAALAVVALQLQADAPDGAVGLARLSFLGVAAYRLLPAAQAVYASLVRIRFDAPALHRIALDLHQRGPAVPPADPDWAGRPRVGIELRGLRFRFQPELPPVLDGVTATIPAGALVGLTGPSGCGKTTLCDVIAGLLAPDTGDVSIDGRRLDADSRTSWQASIAYVPQQPVLLDASVAENVALGVAPERIDAARLQRALEGARLAGFVATLPARERERLGEDGNRLSGGQRQRLGLARALYRDASLLILDEPTSALDPATAQEVLATLRALRGTRTILLVCHDAASVAACDAIIDLSPAAAPPR